MTLVEKGADASVFVKEHSKNAAPIWKALILNVSLLLMEIGFEIFIALLIKNAFGWIDNAFIL